MNQPDAPEDESSWPLILRVGAEVVFVAAGGILAILEAIDRYRLMRFEDEVDRLDLLDEEPHRRADR